MHVRERLVIVVADAFPSAKLQVHLQVEKGATAAVFGLGTIGLAVVDALRDAGAKRIIGIDTDPSKYDRAKTWGATDLINPKDHDKPIQVQPRSDVSHFTLVLALGRTLFCHDHAIHMSCCM